MRKAARHWRLLAAVLAAQCLLAQRPLVRIGFAIDGPWDRNDYAVETFQREIRQLLDREYDVRFPAERTVIADWSAGGVAAQIDALFAADDVDYIVGVGVLSSNDLARRETLSKPVLAPYVIDPMLQGVPYVEVREPRSDAPGDAVYHVSGRDNLSYTVVGADLEVEVAKFLEITPFKRLTILMMQALSDGIPDLAGSLEASVKPLGIEVSTTTVGFSVEDALARIPAETEAVYVTPLLQLPPGGIEELSEGLIARRLPSFSLWGRPEVERGIMAGLALDRDFDRAARRTALNLHRIVLGERARDLPVNLVQAQRLTLNVRTARGVGVYRTWDILTEAELIDAGTEAPQRRLSLTQVILEASQANLDLAAADRRVAAGLQLIREARANLLPSLDVSALETIIDKDRADASFGSQGQSQISGSLGLTQLIYSDQARAGVQIERRLQVSRRQERRELLLDVVVEAAQAYLDVLRAKTRERIQRDNMELTRENLERAQARRDLGAAGPGEVFRWESQLANNRADFIAAGAIRNQAEINVNRILNRPAEEPFDTLEAGMDDESLAVNYEDLRRYIDNQDGFRIFRDFMTREALNQSPELAQLDAGILAQERVLLASKRVFHRPVVALQTDLTGFKNSGVAENPLASIPAPEGAMVNFPQPNNLNWSVGVNASLPLFQGGALRAQRSRAEIELDELTVQREAVRLRVEQRMRSTLHQTMASFAAIDLTAQAAEAAKNNLDLVADAYSEGVVDILRLLDAQNQSLVAELAAANAVYTFLFDRMDVQRAAGNFDQFSSGVDRDDFLNRMEEYFNERGYQRR